MSTREPRRADWFAEDLAAAGVGRRSVHGTLVSAVGRSAGLVLQFGSLVVLARLLTPGDFGLVAMVTVVIGFTGVFQDLGLSAATVRAARTTHEQVTNLFWINVVVGAVIALVVVAGAPALAAFYGDERLAAVAQVLAIGIATGGLGTQHGALLRRAMRYGQMSLMAVVSTAVSVGVAIAAAVDGAQYWALVAGTLAGSVTSTLMSWHFCDWRPGSPRRNVGTRVLATFGMHLTAFGTLAYVANNLPSIIIGRLWGPSTTGLFVRASAFATRLRSHLVEPLRVVVPATMARLVGEPRKYSEYYYTACAVALMGAMPLTFVCFALPRELVAVLLGEQWRGTGELLRLLSFGIAPQVLLASVGWVYLSGGRSARMLQWGVVGWGVTIAAILLLARYRLQGIAIAMSATAILLLVPGLLMAFDGTPLRLRALFRRIAPTFLAGVVAGVVAWTGLQAMPESPWLRLLGGGVLYAAVYLVLLLGVFGQRRLIVDILSHLRPVPVR